MGSQNSKNQNHSSTENKEEADKNDDGGVSGAVLAGVAVAAVGATALAVWGLSKHIGSSEPEENNMLMGSTGTGSFKLESIDDDDKWTKPKYGWFKLNTDAGEASAGGLIRDHTGKWIVGFTGRFVEPCHSIKAELQALREGMKLACDRGLKKVIIETDCEQAVNLIKNPKWNSENHSYGCIIEECRNLMMKLGDWNINIIELNHIYRKNNECADAMAKMAKNQIEPLKIWEQAPTNFRIQYWLSVDMI